MLNIRRLDMERKTIQIPIGAWKSLMTIKRQTGETFSAIIDRLVKEEEANHETT